MYQYQVKLAILRQPELQYAVRSMFVRNQFSGANFDLLVAHKPKLAELYCLKLFNQDALAALNSMATLALTQGS